MAAKAASALRRVCAAPGRADAPPRPPAGPGRADGGGAERRRAARACPWAAHQNPPIPARRPPLPQRQRLAAGGGHRAGETEGAARGGVRAGGMRAARRLVCGGRGPRARGAPPHGGRVQQPPQRAGGGPKVRGHTSRAPPAVIEPTSPQTKLVALPTTPHMLCLCIAMMPSPPGVCADEHRPPPLAHARWPVRKCPVTGHFQGRRRRARPTLRGWTAAGSTPGWPGPGPGVMRGTSESSGLACTDAGPKAGGGPRAAGGGAAQRAAGRHAVFTERSSNGEGGGRGLGGGGREGGGGGG